MEKKEQYWQRALQLQVLVVETHTVSLGKGNVMITNLFIAEKAAGTWSVYMTGTNIASPNLGSAFIGGTKYSSVKMKVSYILED